MIGFLLFLFGLLATVGMCGLAAWSDFKGFKISNLVPLVIIAAFAVAFAGASLTGQREEVFMAIGKHLGMGFVVLMATMAMYAFKLFGAGDSKFASALALWMTPQGLAAFFFYMTIIGGLIGLASLAMRKWKPFKRPPAGSWIEKAQAGHNKVPYGIAIAGGAIIAFFFMDYFNLENWATLVGGDA